VYQLLLKALDMASDDELLVRLGTVAYLYTEELKLSSQEPMKHWSQALDLNKENPEALYSMALFSLFKDENEDRAIAYL